jgi:hypothetical protein
MSKKDDKAAISGEVRDSRGRFLRGCRPTGKQRGTPNATTKALKDMILGALDDNGGQAYLAEQATKSPAAFLALIGKVLPVTLQGGGDHGEIVVRWEQ